MLPTTQHIIATIKNEEAYLKTRYFIKHTDLYGSCAKKQQQAHSDIDLLYTTIPNGSMTLARLKSVEKYLSQLLKVDKIELVSKQSIIPVIEKTLRAMPSLIF